MSKKDYHASFATLDSVQFIAGWLFVPDLFNIALKWFRCWLFFQAYFPLSIYIGKINLHLFFLVFQVEANVDIWECGQDSAVYYGMSCTEKLNYLNYCFCDSYQYDVYAESCSGVYITYSFHYLAPEHVA